MLMVPRGSLSSVLVTCLGGANFVTEEDVFLDDMGVHFRGGVSRVRISEVADDEIVSWRERRVLACGLTSRCERNSDVQGHQSFTVQNGSQPTAGDPELTKDQGDRDRQKGELAARVPRTFVLQR